MLISPKRPELASLVNNQENAPDVPGRIISLLNTVRLGSAAILLLSGSHLFASPLGIVQQQDQSAEVILVDEIGLTTYQDRNRYELSGPTGEARVRVFCRSGSVDEPCRNEARYLLKQRTAQHESNLAVIVAESILESNPPQYELSAVLYLIKPRR